jgi:polar amino acid transport system ATP-binding protein
VVKWDGSKRLNRTVPFKGLKAVPFKGSEGMTTLIATHEMHFAREMADRVIVIENGDIVESGSPEQIFTSPQTERTKTFLRRVLTRFVF